MPADFSQEGRRLVAAAALLTRMPLPRVEIEPDWLPRSAKYFPLVGAVVGLLAASVLLAAAAVWPRPIPEVLALVAGLVATGALHEDGLADSFDALGGATREARLAILKDSRLGTYGALALLAALASALAALAALPLPAAAAALVAAHAGGRLAAIVMLAAQPYAGDVAAAKLAAAGDRPGGAELAVGAMFAAGALVPITLLAPAQALTGLALGAGFAGVLAWRLCRILGGQTGDVLGAVAVAFEIGFLLGAAAAPAG